MACFFATVRDLEVFYRLTGNRPHPNGAQRACPDKKPMFSRMRNSVSHSRMNHTNLQRYTPLRTPKDTALPARHTPAQQGKASYFMPSFSISTRIGLAPPTKHSTAMTIRISPIRRIITLLPVSPNTLTSRVEARRMKNVSR